MSLLEFARHDSGFILPPPIYDEEGSGDLSGKLRELARRLRYQENQRIDNALMLIDPAEYPHVSLNRYPNGSTGIVWRGQEFACINSLFSVGSVVVW